MSTRSIIAIPEGDGFKGRYCHSDGYPKGQLPALHKVITETFNGDIDAALQALIHDNYSWSSISGDQEPAEWYRTSSYNDDPRFKWVPGIGCAHTDTMLKDGYQQTNADWWITYQGEDTLDTDCQWVYVIDPSSRRITVFIIVNEVPTYIGGFNIDTLDLSDEHLTEIECGREWERCPHYAWYHFEEANSKPEYRKINTLVWLGRKPVDTTDFHSAIGVYYYGERYTMGSSGGCPRLFNRHTGRYEYDGRYWDADVVDEQGNHRVLRIARQYKTVPPKPAKGVEWIFPQVPENPDLRRALIES